ncbi:MAG: hypothetical protein KCHDKBKB_02294 [Elusimicrobia bacterium]|nr:hypothetical protein [Elusimicrobiota bacterium]
MDLLFEVTSCLSRKIRTTLSHWRLISLRKHPEMQGYEHFVQFALIDADSVRKSSDDDNVYLYYKRFKKYFICVVCKHLNGSGYVITSYLTNKIKEGELVWQK